MFAVRRTLATLGLSLFILAAVACGQSSSPERELFNEPATEEQPQSAQAVQAPASARTQPESAATPRSLAVSPSHPSSPASPPPADGAPAVLERSVEVEREVSKEAYAMAESAPAAVQQASSNAASSASAQPRSQPTPAPQVAAAPGPAGPAGPPGPLGPQGPAASQSSGPAPTAVPSTVTRRGPAGQSQPGATTFQDNWRIPAVSTRDDAVSTFSLDTDRTSYRLALNWASQGYDVEPDSVRAEEWVNSFNYGYGLPNRDDEFAIYTDVYRHPLDDQRHLARVAFQAPDLHDDSRPLNVTLVLDASGSMGDGNRVAIARAAADAIRKSLREQDRIAVVHFTDTVIGRLTVEHSRPDDRDVRRSIDRLQPNGATNVQAGLDLGVNWPMRPAAVAPTLTTTSFSCPTGWPTWMPPTPLPSWSRRETASGKIPSA